jgi:tetratricopeptide (TPR) repeat protein
MARAAVKAKQQARAKAQPRTPKHGGRRRGSGGGNPNQDLFFMKLRRHAKWAYVALAVLFAVTFAGLGVGSGSSGLDQLFSGLNVFGGGSGGSSVSKALKEVDKSPNAPKGYRDLATAYEQKGDTNGAITALESLTGLQKKNANAFAELAGLQLSLAQQYAAQYQSAASAQQLAAPSASFLPTGTLGTAIGTNPIEQAAAQQANTQASDLYQKASLAYSQSLTAYRTVAKLRPHDANAEFQVANAAQSAGNYPVAVAALKKYLAMNPETTQKAQIQNLIKQLQAAISPAPTKPAKPKPAKGK